MNKGDTFTIGSTVHTVVCEKPSQINGDPVVIATYMADDGYENYYEFSKAELIEIGVA